MNVHIYTPPADLERSHFDILHDVHNFVGGHFELKAFWLIIIYFASVTSEIERKTHMSTFSKLFE